MLTFLCSETFKIFNPVRKETAETYASCLTRYVIFMCRCTEQNIDIHLSDDEKRRFTQLREALGRDRPVEETVRLAIREAWRAIFFRENSDDDRDTPTCIGTAALSLNDHGHIGRTASFTAFSSAMKFSARILVLLDTREKSQSAHIKLKE